ncbi:hypothetical protein ACJGE4_15605 [Bacillus velezensis]|uniref:hypothetical protein n=2 Tax=Bacillus subtilis group TaxID=653685 RepID=UPI000C057E4C|nr:hypothetical protein [Bacillus velezensis]ATO08506.1 hypothetical protein CRH11_00095 [Bacillus velezensis]ATO12238.1 hypothetical protein CRH11_20550 [Bacillus velezensis]AZI48244.1 hypothetical protein BVMH_15670 [Bacillus velezensis]QAW23940.1 hypothetical protein ETA12_04670 [Bacillus velezensis]
MKPTITKEQAKELEAYRRSGDLDIQILEAACDEVIGGKLAKLDLLTLAAALLNGYEVEATPEDRVREYYDELQEKQRTSQSRGVTFSLECEREGVINTLNLLGIKIEGVNAR